jgi:PilZ domain-containing protein
MPPAPGPASCSRPTGMYQSNRRVHQRYPITLEVECKLLDGTGVQRKEFGRTINISSGGVLLDLKHTPPTLSSIELSVEWPFLLDGSIPLKWMVHGNIVRITGNRVAVEVTKHEFHTAGQDPFKQRGQQ